jgi:hypothetical protein
MTPAAKMRGRSPKEIIDQEIAENRPWEWMLYVLTCVLVGEGLPGDRVKGDM